MTADFTKCTGRGDFQRQSRRPHITLVPGLKQPLLLLLKQLLMRGMGMVAKAYIGIANGSP